MAFMIYCGKNVLGPERLHMAIWHMHITCWIRKATNKHSQYVIRTASGLQRTLHVSSSMLNYSTLSLHFGLRVSECHVNYGDWK
jgi:hypothetical protein